RSSGLTGRTMDAGAPPRARPPGGPSPAAVAPGIRWLDRPSHPIYRRQSRNSSYQWLVHLIAVRHTVPRVSRETLLEQFETLIRLAFRLVSIRPGKPDAINGAPNALRGCFGGRRGVLDYLNSGRLRRVQT